MTRQTHPRSTRRHAAVAAAAIAALTLLGAACGGESNPGFEQSSNTDESEIQAPPATDDADETIASPTTDHTDNTTEVSGPDTTEQNVPTFDPSTTTDPETTKSTLQPTETSAPTDTGGEQPTGTPGGSTAEDLVATARSVYGPTTDVNAALGAYLPVPAGIPTPDGADVIGFAARIDSGPNDTLLANSHVRFAAPGTLDDLVTFYTTSLIAAGYGQTGSGDDTTSSGNPLRTVEFSIPGATYAAAGLDLTVIDFGDERYVEIQINDQPDAAAMAAAKERLGAWVQTFPGRGEDVSDYQVKLTVDTVSGPYIQLNVAGYGTLSQADQNAAIAGALPDGTYSIDPTGTAAPGQITLQREGWDEVTALIGDGTGSLGTLVNITMQADL